VTGAVELEQRVHATRALVELSEPGAALRSDTIVRDDRVAASSRSS
jgi:hypothetical protein